MEKAHNWEYVRSKSKGSRAVAQQKLDDDGYPLNNHGMMLDTDLRNTPASASPRSLITPPAGVDFILFDDQEDAIGDHDDNLYSHYADAHNVESYLPWTSPTTRLRDNELVLERFSQTYNSMQANASTAVGTYGVGPGLALSNFPSHGLQHYPKIGHPVPFTANVTIKVESPILTLDTAIPRKRKYEPVEAPLAHLEQVPASTSSMRPNPSQKTGAGQGTPTPSRARPASKCENSSGEDVGRPKKKTKPNSTEDFDDMSMPDIFRHAHPTLYDKDRSDKYSPCHTVHREISTLVRHLSRPAHRLTVTERAIHSFDVQDSDFRHPRVGVCRSCWRTFDNRPAFDDHLSRYCQRVSKGKKEKWRVLFKSFTPLQGSTETRFLSAESTQQAESGLGRVSDYPDESLILDVGDDFDAARTPSTSVPSPVTLSLADPAATGPGSERFVPADEHSRLQMEHEALRERHQQLERMAQALLIEHLMQENLKPATTLDHDVKPPSSGSPKKSYSATSPAISERDNLVQHMDSQSTDVDVHAFMEEVEGTRQSPSRMSSGLTTASRSTIHRVPPSPPSRHAELPDAKQGDQTSHQTKDTLPHRPPPLPSIPDSGYGTENRRGSLGDLLAGVGAGADAGQLETPLRPRTPPSSSEAAQEPKRTPGGEGIPWGKSLSQQTPRVSGITPSSSSSSLSHHNQVGFLTDQYMADYHDDSYDMFYQDNDFQALPSSPGFTFDFTSQAE
ncbi:hypothetical protein CHGG_02902 [Chaetomium globosum CBS 148.51]|uniref:C2H2-type domain-containing protein n=1 Tax=Chaetomium globosum (strain ATCC 6205 / CBS 148.51 / DSM 1962 / NBRC 6347 / NRRL 1970) TaxID=306901 RepID=Q2HA52_CHAGB|nr:uncharacterized protein CHGG_02902 [Chaetomium globosum CBS 148.51]EAQ90967.1 hypothetical protein CHGG_02902 [Chaetomium globosum CBS 148.51]